MMKLKDLLILVPCHGIEDFCTHLEDHDANSLLAGWCGLWHPWLIAAAGSLPHWKRVDEIPESPEAAVIVVPTGSKQLMDEPTYRRISAGLLVPQPQAPEEVIQSILESERAHGVSEASRGFEFELVQDFYALGYSLLQVQLLTYHMRHTSHVDEDTLSRLAVDAAVAAEQQDRAAARNLLTQCFQLLAKERDDYYPVDVFLLDVNLYHPGCDLTALERDMAHVTAGNLLIGGDDLRGLADRDPQLIQALREGVAAERLSILGGDAIPLPLELVTCESVLRQLQAGLLAFQQLLGTAPQIYARGRFGLTTTLPGILERLDFQAVWHTTLDDGRLPDASQIRGPWEGCDGHTIDMVSRSPLDGGRPSTYLSFATRLGESMETDFVATVALAHWPGAASRWHEMLCRATNRGLALGRFVTFDSYRQEATDLGHIDSFSADQYRWPYLRQAVRDGQRDPISRWQRYWKWQTQLQAAGALECWTAMIAGSPDTSRSAVGNHNASQAREQLGDQIDRSLLVPVPTAVVETEQHVASVLAAAASRLAAALGAQVPAREPPGAESVATATVPSLPPTDQVSAPVSAPRENGGIFLLNPWTAPARYVLELPESDEPVTEDVTPAIYHVSHRDLRSRAVIDIPAAGFVAWPPAVRHVGRPPAHKPQHDSIAQTPHAKRSAAQHPGDFVLANEFLRAEIHPKSGALRALYSNSVRGNRISQQLAIRVPASEDLPGQRWTGSEPQASYSRMEAEQITVGKGSEASTIAGEVEVAGRLLAGEDGHEWAKFRQTYRLQRGRRVLELTIQLEPSQSLTGDPWDSYYACRFAWPDPSSQLVRTLHGTRQVTRLRRINSPLYVDIDDAVERTTLLVGGLPFHHRVNQRMLDSLLIVQGESERTFRLGIGVGLPSPYAEAVSQLVPPVATDGPHAIAENTGWLCHLGARNLVATAWQPLYSDDSDNSPKTCCGLRVRLLETMGKATRTSLQFCRPIQQSQLVGFNGAKHAACDVMEGAVRIDVAAHEWTELEVYW